MNLSANWSRFVIAVAWSALACVPLRASSPTVGTTTFDGLPFASVSGQVTAGNAQAYTDAAGWDISSKGFTSGFINTSINNNITVSANTAGGPREITLRANDGSAFDLQSIVMALGWSTVHNGDSVSVTLTGYLQGSAVSGATTTLNLTHPNGTGLGTAQTFDLSSNAQFDRIDEFRITTAVLSGGAITSVTIDNITIQAAPIPPTVSSPTSANLFSSMATLGGTVDAAGDSAITARGVVLALTATNNNPRIGGASVTNLVEGATTTATFTVSATGLTPNTGYSYAAYATNNGGTTYTSVGTFTTTARPTITGSTGAASPTPVDNTQPSLGIRWAIATQGVFPNQNSVGADAVIGEIRPFASGTALPAGWLECDGSSLSIAANQALFSILGTSFGWNGSTTFKLPDLRDRVPIGAGQGPGLTNRNVGDTGGGETNTLGAATIPAHTHTAASGVSQSTGGGGTLDNLQPWLAVTTFLTTTGVFPDELSWVRFFAGTFAPGGIACDGRTLPVSSHTALFSLLGTNYGGNGSTTFGVPDLRGRVAIGAGQGSGLTDRARGEVAGSETITLTTAQLPAHTHTYDGGNTGSAGGDQAHDTMQPYLAMPVMILTSAINATDYIGELRVRAGTMGAATSILSADGATRDPAADATLFTAIGTTFGGDGATTFALPDTAGRTLVGVGTGNGLTARARGDKWGAETVTLTSAQLPAHTHDVFFRPVIAGTLTASGSFVPGGTVTYTVTLSNSGSGDQTDNSGNEFSDVLPAGLTLVSASATSGTAVANTGTNTVTWNGSIAASGSVTITITATVGGSASGSISNQGSISYDADGNGSNEATAQTDDPNVNGAANATAFNLPDYLVSTSGGAIVVTDISGSSDTLAVSESSGSVVFTATGRTFSVDGGAAISNSATISLSGATSITVNAGAGNDTINVGAFATTLPNLTINGGAGNDTINFNGAITFAANASLDVDLQNDTGSPGNDEVNVLGHLTASGSGALTFKASVSVLVDVGGGLQTANGDITLEANQQTVATAGNDAGVQIGAVTLTTSGTGSIVIRGRAGSGATGQQLGVLIQSGTVTTTSTAANAGGITIEGATLASTNGAYGVAISLGAKVKTSGPAAPITITGAFGPNTTATGYGIYIAGASTEVSSAGGLITITGQGGATTGVGASSLGSVGFLVTSSAVVTATASGEIRITGTAGNSDGASQGVRVDAPAAISSVDGNITIDATGGTGVGGANHGASIRGNVQASGTGNISVTGTAGTSGPNTTQGVQVRGGAVVSSANGTITLTGTGANTAGEEAIGLAPAGNATLSISNGAKEIKLVGDSIAIHPANATLNAGTGTVKLLPKTNGTLIDLGGADVAGTLGLTDAEFDRITASSLIIGTSSSGALTVSSAISRAAATTMKLSSSGTIALNGALDSGGGDVTLDGATMTAGGSGTDLTAGLVTFRPAGSVSFGLTTTAVDTGYAQLKIAGNVALGASVALTGSYTSVAGDTFVLIDNDGSDAISGTFTGLAEGATLSDVLGSGLKARMSYIGGDGNDATLTILSNNANASDIALSAGTLNTTFASGTTSYATTLPSTTRTITVTPTLAQANATVTVNGNAVNSGDASGAINLVAGANTIPVVVTAEDGTAKTYTFTVTRAAGPGDPDLSFDPNSNGDVSTVVAQPDGKILVGGGFTSIAGASRNNIARLNADGTIDPTFNPDADNTVDVIAVQTDGKIILAGDFTMIGGAAHARIVRLNADGTVDPGFMPDAFGAAIQSVVVQPDAKIVVGGSFTMIGATARNHIARLNADGTLDANFDPNADGAVRAIVLQSDGKIVVGGGFANIAGLARGGVARLAADGTGDAGFTPQPVTPAGTVHSLAMQADGMILVGGTFTNFTPFNPAFPYLARLRANGFMDFSFRPGVNSFVFAVAAQADGKILIGGSFTTVGGASRNCVARLNADGTLDADFVSNASANVMSIAVQADGGVLLGGYFGSVGGLGRSRVARLVNDAATNALTATSGNRVQWLRGGASAGISLATFELSTDNGSTWAPLGGGTAISGGWELTGLSLPANGTVRARGFIEGAAYSSYVEQTYAFTNLTSAPAIVAPSSAAIANTTATLGGNVTSDGNSAITEIGVIYAPTATNANPQIGGTGVTKVTGTGTTGVFTVNVTSLQPGTAYSYAAYAKNSVSTSYTTAGTFTTLSANADLSALALSGGTLDPAFSGVTTSYTASVPNSTTSVTVTPTVAESHATVTVNGSAAASGQASAPITLQVGGNTITVLGRAQDGTTTRTYTVLVTRDTPPVTPVTVTLVGLAAVYDGKPKTVTATTAPANVNVAISYVGRSEPPVEAGSYPVVANVLTGGFSGSTNGTLVIAKADQTIVFSPTGGNIPLTQTIVLSASASSKLPVSFEVVSGAGNIADNKLTFTNAGDVVVRAVQKGNANFNAAPEVTNTYTVTVSKARVFFGSATFTESAASVPGRRRARSSGGDVAAYIPAGSNSGSILIVAPDAGINELIGFTLAGDNTFTVSATQHSGETTRSLSGSGSLAGSTLSGSFPEIGFSFSAAVEPPSGSSFSAQGLYVANALNTNNGTTYTIVGANNNALVLVVTPTVTVGGATTVQDGGAFSFSSGDVTLSGTLDAPTATIAGTLVVGGQSAIGVAGLEATTQRTDRLVALSSRGRVDAGEKLMIAGFVINGAVPKQVLVRAVGPQLATLGVNDYLADPQLSVIRDGVVVGENDNWDSNSAALVDAIARTGASAFTAGSKDAALLLTLQPGIYHLHVTGSGPATAGVALAEIYDASENPGGEVQRLLAISTRGEVGTGENILIGGLVVTGNAPKKLLVRGVGPALASQGVAGPLLDPTLAIYKGETVVASNDDWSTDAAAAMEITDAESITGAAPLPVNGKDAAIIVTLAPGIYTVHVAGKNGAKGVALVEVFEIPE